MKTVQDIIAKEETAVADKEKAKEYFGKTLAIDPANAYAADNLKVLNAPAPAKKAPIKK